MDAPVPSRRSIGGVPIAASVVVAMILLAPVAAWFHSRARQADIDRRTSERLRPGE